MEKVKKKLYSLFENYSSIPNSSTTASTSTTASSSTSSTHKVTSSLFNALKEHNQQLATSIGKSQLDIYLEEPSLDSTYQNYDDLNVLQWWKENSFNSSAVVGDNGERDGGRFQPTTTTSTEAYDVYDLDVDED
ncbi:hypothetical protein P8452_03764 [Trifolium repens]|nr:hypothetical protein P8452_03764 [Trifolium repens]